MLGIILVANVQNVAGEGFWVYKTVAWAIIWSFAVGGHKKMAMYI